MDEVKKLVQMLVEMLKQQASRVQPWAAMLWASLPEPNLFASIEKLSARP
jgi:hypothetical protein